MFYGQTQVNQYQASFVPGDQQDSSNMVALPYQLQSGDVPNVVASTAYTAVSGQQNVAQAGNPEGANFYVGILVNSKSYSLFGTVGLPLAPSMTLANGVTATIQSIGSTDVILTNSTANIGDLVIFQNTTGALSSITRTTTVPSGYTPANAYVSNYNTTNNWACIVLNQNVSALYILA